MRHGLSIGLTVMTILIGLGLCPAVLAQDPARAMLVGRWEGTVASFSAPNLQLAGAWVKHAVPGAAGTGVKFTLTVDGDQMKGTEVADMNNTPIAISLTRKK